MLISGLPGDEVIHFRYNHKMECIPIKEIAYIESDNVYSLIYRVAEYNFDKKMICKSLKVLEQILKKFDFIRCHRHYLVNSENVECFSSKDKKVTVLGHQLEISRRKEDKVFTFLLEKGKKDVNSGSANKIFRP